MLSVLRLLALIVPCTLVSCSFHSADLKYPTVAQADEMDVQWGLPKRKPRGGPKQFFQSNTSSAGLTREQQVAQPGNAPAGDVPAPAPAPAPVPVPQPSVNVPANLR